MAKVLIPNENEGSNSQAYLVLIDTEGFDCEVVEGMSPDSIYLPKYLIFEHMHCEYEPAVNHLQGMGYYPTKHDAWGGRDSGNIVAMWMYE